MWFKKYRQNRQLKKQIQALTEVERQEILEKSLLSAGWFQGTGYDVFLKSEPDFDKAYVCSLGHVMRETAEDWVIQQYLLSQQQPGDSYSEQR